MRFQLHVRGVVVAEGVLSVGNSGVRDARDGLSVRPGEAVEVQFMEDEDPTNPARVLKRFRLRGEVTKI